MLQSPLQESNLQPKVASGFEVNYFYRSAMDALTSIDILLHCNYLKEINPFTAIGTAYAVPFIFGVFAIWTALAVSTIIIVKIIN
jgi:hypothetical protein